MFLIKKNRLQAVQNTMNNAFMNPRQQSGRLTNKVTLPKLRGPNPNSLFADHIADNFKSSFSNANINGLMNILNVSDADMKIFDNMNSDVHSRLN
jgi:hypothetical protein